MAARGAGILKRLYLLRRGDARRQDFTRPRGLRLGNWARRERFAAAYANGRPGKQTRC